MAESTLTLDEAQGLVRAGLELIDKKQYSDAQVKIDKASEIFKQANNTEGMSICLSLLGFLNYSTNIKDYQAAIALVHDGSFMAKRSNSDTALMINEAVLGNINFSESNKDVALIHYNNAVRLAVIEDKYNISDMINARIKQLKNNTAYSIPTEIDPLISLVKISNAISSIVNIDELLTVIAYETRQALNADRCSVFLLDKDTDELWSKVALGLDSTKEIRFSVNNGLAGYSVKTGKTLNINDVYNDTRFNPQIDSQTGYKTKTVLCMPIINNTNEIIGAFQVINKLTGEFTERDEELLRAIGGSASVALENAKLFDKQLQMYHEQKLLFESFINALAVSIDARDRITSGHSIRVRLYAVLLAQKSNMDAKEIELLEKAAMLHDIGKVGIPDKILQKADKLTDEEYKLIQEHVRITHTILSQVYMSSDFRIITEIASSHHEKWDGTGYYRHLKGEEITLGGRILAVADVFDAITSKRHYRSKMPIVTVIEILIKGAGSHFDKNLIDIFLNISVNQIIYIILFNTGIAIDPHEDAMLSKYNLLDIYNIAAAENITLEQQSVLDMFNKYYTE